MACRQWVILVSSFLVMVGCGHNRPEFQGNNEVEKFKSFLSWSFDTFMDV